MTRLKILLSAYACEPERGSEPGVGWNLVTEIARKHDVWVITRLSKAEIIESYLKQSDVPAIHWVYHDLPGWIPFSQRLDKLEFVYYLMWQFSIFPLAKRLAKETNFDLIHHVTFATYWMPSLLSLLPAPFIWGPVGGGESVPRTFFSTFGFRGRLYEAIRLCIHRLFEYTPFVRATARHSKLILASTSETKARIVRLTDQNCRVYSQVGISDQEFEILSRVPIEEHGPFRVFSSGVLSHFKGYHIGLAAFAAFHIHVPESEYWLFGDGPEREKLLALCRKLGIINHVRFFGQVPRKVFLENLVHCDVFLHPSLHESGGLAIAEALSAGRPVICFDLGGPGLQVDDNNGVKIPVKTPRDAIHDITGALKTLQDDEKLRREMYRHAIRGVRDNFLWNKKSDFICTLYQQIYDTGLRANG